MKTCWKFLNLGIGPDGREEAISAHDGSPWVIGEWRDTGGDPDEVECCVHGFHCSPDPLAALGYVVGEVVAEVEVEGASDQRSDKSAHQRMRIVRAWRWTRRDSVALAIYAAEHVLDIYERAYPSDTRPRRAIEAARAYLEGHDPAAADAAAAAARAADAAAAAARAAAAAAAARAAYAAAAARAADAAAAAARAAAAADATADAARAGSRQRIADWMIEYIEALPEEARL